MTPIRLARLGRYPALGHARAGSTTALRIARFVQLGFVQPLRRRVAASTISFGERITFAGHVFMRIRAGRATRFRSGRRRGWAATRACSTDQETLRGYGAGRFIDNNLFVMNIEMRTRVWDKTILGTHGILELAPFAEAGRVCAQYRVTTRSRNCTRSAALDSAVSRSRSWSAIVDVGWGGEGAAVFSGINYPF